MIDDWRWSGVPFYVRTGKRLPKRSTEIAIQYREVPHRLFKDEGVEPDPNLLAIRIQPDEGIMLRFGAKVPGLGLDVRSVTMDFTYGSAFSVDSPDAYETLILDALQGDASLFTRVDQGQATLRERYDLAPAAPVALFFGGLRPSKGEGLGGGLRPLPASLFFIRIGFGRVGEGVALPENPSPHFYMH